MWNQNTPQGQYNQQGGDYPVGQPVYSGQDQSSGPHCKQNHPLTLTSVLPQNYPNGNYKCDICKVGRYCSPQYKVWHCNFCMFDVCFDCAKNYKQHQYPQQQKQDPNSLQYPSLTPFPEQAPIPQQNPNPRPQPNKMPAGQVTPVAHPKCRNGHNLILTSQLPPSYANNTFGCDGCQSLQVVSPQNQAWHCEACTFDLCRKCAMKNPGFMPQGTGQMPYGGGMAMGGGMGVGMGGMGGGGMGYGMDPVIANMFVNLARR